MDRIFCESCGNNSLLRTSVSVGKGGEMKIHLKQNFQYNNRGTKYSIPAPKGGRKSNDLILREDQKEYQRAIAQKKRMDKKIMNQEMTMDELVSFVRDGRLTATGAPIIGHGRKNVNQVTSGRRRK
jgi:RNA-binding protein NOB1